jgi:flagellar basal-body rod modification protein FlgD
MSSIASILGTNTPTATPATADPKSDQLTSKQTFLQLLVAQIKNQDPTNPTDATQFVGQLTQYSQLEQLININTRLTKIETAAAAPVTTPATP